MQDDNDQQKQDNSDYGKEVDTMDNLLHLKAVLPVNALNAGYFISRGTGKHVDRTMDSFEIIYVNSGVLGIFEEDVTYNVEKGQALILFPQRHHGGTTTFDKNLSFYWLHFLIDEKAAHIGESIMSLPQLIHLAKPDQFVELLRRFIKRQDVGRQDNTILNLILLEILCELSDSICPIETNSQKMVLAQRAEQYIRLHLSEPLSSTIISDALGCNVDYLGRIFNMVFGKTLTDSIHQNRLNLACKLLIETTWNINEISYQCGFTDADYFRRVFKKYRGMTPKLYRQTYCLVAVEVD